MMVIKIMILKINSNNQLNFTKNYNIKHKIKIHQQSFKNINKNKLKTKIKINKNNTKIYNKKNNNSR